MSETSHFSVLSFSFLPLSCNANLLITGFERARRLKGQVTFLTLSLLASLCGDECFGFNCVCTNKLEFFGLLYLHFQLCDWSNLSTSHLRMHTSCTSVCACAWLSVFCVHMMGLESRRWQITCNCDLLWWGINFAVLHAVK